MRGFILTGLLLSALICAPYLQLASEAYASISTLEKNLPAHTFQAISTSSGKFPYKVTTDADIIEYEYWLNNKKIFAGSKFLNNSTDKKISAVIYPNFKTEGNYQIRYRLIDDVKNISRQYIQPIAYKKPPKPRILGEKDDKQEDMYGVDASSPWGRDNHYQENTINMRLEIDTSKRPLYYEFVDIQIPGPLLTYSTTKGNEMAIYGHAVSKKTSFKIKVYKWRKGKFEYAGTKVIAPQHIRVALFKNGKEIRSFWQETYTRFRTSLSGLKKGDKLSAKAYIYGDFEYLDGKVDYRNPNSLTKKGSGLPSSLSNTITFGMSSSQNTSKKLNITYFNQAVNAAGKWEYWSGWQKLAGGQSCGAASSVMINSFFKKLPANDSLKSYAFKDNDQNLRSKRCARPGAFAVTAYDSACNQSSLAGITSYLAQYGLKVKVYWPSAANNFSLSQDIVRKAIDKNHPLILSYKKPIGHILVVKGYTYKDQIIVNDPYRDIQNNYIKAKYDYSGKDAIYTLRPNNSFQINYLMEIYK